MPSCLICDSPIEPFLSFGKMPIANGFLTPEQFADEWFFDLQVGFCSVCAMVQLTELVPRERMFHDHYAFFSSTSRAMAAHFENFASWLWKDHLPAHDPMVVELGSNDGILLRHFADNGIRHLGIEPSANVAGVARARGMNVVSEFFDEQLARRILDEHGHAHAIVGANVMCHIPYLHSVLAGMKLLLADDGVIVFEDPYLGDIVTKTAYDQIYDEHAFYFSVHSISNLFARHDLEVVDVIPQKVHGGSMRYVIAHRGRKPVSAAVESQLTKERAMGLAGKETFDEFRLNVERSRTELVRLLEQVRAGGQRAVGYAATSKSTTVLNYCGITPDLIEYISDTTPIKIGKFSPGMHIPIRSHDEFAARYPSHALLFGWNHAEEIMAAEQPFRDAGGRWIVYVPSVQAI
jgi:methylation protein EvaC